jgi:hypothetical protein
MTDLSGKTALITGPGTARLVRQSHRVKEEIR